MSESESGLKLNIGCGADSWGDVRLDLSEHYLGTSSMLNIVADAQFLPFKGGSFDVVKASHILEHLANPYLALREMTRVCVNTIILKFPTEKDIFPNLLINMLPPTKNLYYLLKGRRERHHLWLLNQDAIARFLQKNGFDIIKLSKTTCSIIPMLEFGRKARLFKFISARLRIPFECVVSATKQ